MVKDIVPGRGDSFQEELTNANGTQFFIFGRGESGDELWKSNGTAAGTVRVKNVPFLVGLTYVSWPILRPTCEWEPWEAPSTPPESCPVA